LSGTPGVYRLASRHRPHGGGGNAVSGIVGIILRAEYLAILVTGFVLWVAQGGSVIWVLPALLAPDLSVIGYLAGPRIGAIMYNSVHNLVVALAALGIGFLAASQPLVLAGAILVAHIGMDRTSGFGLKYPTAFGDTHLGRIGRNRAASAG
jgi:hypothetical protein